VGVIHNNCIVSFFVGSHIQKNRIFEGIGFIDYSRVYVFNYSHFLYLHAYQEKPKKAGNDCSGDGDEEKQTKAVSLYCKNLVS